jgi:hypothetical protein
LLSPQSYAANQSTLHRPDSLLHVKGTQFARRSEDGDVNLLKLLTAGLVVSVGGCGTAAQDDTAKSALATSIPGAASVDMRELNASEKAILAEGFASGLNDPDTVKFRWTKVPKVINSSGAPFEYCAQLDMKNAQGVYNGTQPFLAAITTSYGAITGGAIAALSSDNRPEYRNVIPKLCQQKGLDPG